MELLLFVGQILLTALVGIVLLGCVFYLPYWLIKRHLLLTGRITETRSRQLNIIYLLGFSLFIAWQIYFAFYPANSFYEREFKEHTGIELPSSADIIDKGASYPDQFGDYESVAIIRFSPSDYEQLQKKIASNKDFEQDEKKEIGVTSTYRSIGTKISDGNIAILYANDKVHWFRIAFLQDGQTITFERSSS